jgi:electron transfer flavoprotein beta subunit
VKAIVCVKQVPDTSEIQVRAETGTLIREGVPCIMNPFDTYAVEEALQLKDRFGGEVIAISMGPTQAIEILKHTIAMGADEAILLSDEAFAGADTWATAYTLSRAVRKIGDFDIILCGKQAIDGDTGQVGPAIARMLDVELLTYVLDIKAVDFDLHQIAVQRLLEEGREVVETQLPAVLTVLKDINQPRLPTLPGIRKATTTKIPVWSAGDLPSIERRLLGLNGSPTRVERVFSPQPRGGETKWIQDERPEAAAAILADLLLRENII